MSESTLKIHASDGLENVASGIGGQMAKRAFNRWSYSSLFDYQQFEASYESSWLARNIVDCIAEDACREWREIKCKDADQVRSLEDKLGIVAKVTDALRWARLYGGAGILMVTDQALDQPLEINRVRRDSLKSLVVLDRNYLVPCPDANNILNPASPDFMKPEYFLVSGSETARVHSSHVCIFDGEPLPIRRRIGNGGWGDSSLRKALDPVEDFLMSTFGVAESLQEFNVDVVKREGMFEDLSSDQDNQIIKRFNSFRLMKSVVHLALLDGSEELQRQAINYSGVADMIRVLQEILSGASKTPITKLFGVAPAGLNSTGEGDRRNYNEVLQSVQSTRIDPAIRKLDEVLVRSAIGYFPEDYNYEWRPFYRPSDLEEAQANNTQADADIKYLEAGVLNVSQVQRNLQAKERYTFDDDKIEELERLEAQGDLDDFTNEQNQSERNEPPSEPTQE